jgi:hypothetical protein
MSTKGARFHRTATTRITAEERAARWAAHVDGLTVRRLDLRATRTKASSSGWKTPAAAFPRRGSASSR